MSSSHHPPAEPPTHVFDLSGGSLCLDFANTVADRPRNEQEHLKEYRDLLDWAAQVDIVDEEQMHRLARLARRLEGDAEAVFSRALDLRECLYRIFSRIAVNRPPADRDLDELNQWLTATLARLRLEARGEHLSWTWSDADTELESVLWPVVRSAADLLTSGELARVGECDGDPCSWLFVDRSRTGRRRWCDMKTCGNRDKARRYYRRQKKRGKATASSD
ncbi:MAG: ABATE domain-containing protein [Acidobacteriota bacterium]